MKIGVYVGSFDPVHLGHLQIINYLLSSKTIDKIIVIPTGNYWNKKNLTDIKDRIDMLKLFETESIIIDSELFRFQYTYQILDELRKCYSNILFHLIIGADNLEKFHLWKNTENILKDKIIVINRNGININSFDSKNSFIEINGLKENNISSTEIRRKIKNNEDVSKLLDIKVKDYIDNHELYRD
ncbi:MAG: nicotinate (nicotinamide) nucleotide adenylyltransferase [Bacilli bacterium]